MYCGKKIASKMLFITILQGTKGVNASGIFVKGHISRPSCGKISLLSRDEAMSQQHSKCCSK